MHYNKLFEIKSRYGTYIFLHKTGAKLLKLDDCINFIIIFTIFLKPI